MIGNIISFILGANISLIFYAIFLIGKNADVEFENKEENIE